MTALTDVYMENQDNNKVFMFRGVIPANRRRSQPSITIPIVNNTEDDAALFRFSGQTGTFDFSFLLFDDGTDVSDGTEVGGVVTVEEQVHYLFDTFFTQHHDVTWTLSCGDFFSSTISGVIEDLDVGAVGGPTFRTGTMRFKLGRLMTL